MKQRAIPIHISVMWLLMALSGCHAGQDDAGPRTGLTVSDNPPTGQDGAAGVVRLSGVQQRLAGIVTEALAPRVLKRSVRAPGEVVLNAYATAQVTPRIQAQVVARHAKLGDQIKKDQSLVTLSSVEMANAQNTLVIAEREWARVQQLGREIVSDRRFVETEITARQARATARAYGVSPMQIDALVRHTDADPADGRFTLLSPRPGTVIQDAFFIGEMIEPGRVLFEITDESTRWIDARPSAEEADAVSIGDTARIVVRGRSLQGHVIQIFQAIDESTRTLPLRIEVSDPDESLRPGLFVDVDITHRGGEPVLALPEPAVLPTPDGNWNVFVETSPGEYRPVEVTLLDAAGGLATIDGIAPGTMVVVDGAFFLQSELEKSGFEIDDD